MAIGQRFPGALSSPSMDEVPESSVFPGMLSFHALLLLPPSHQPTRQLDVFTAL